MSSRSPKHLRVLTYNIHKGFSTGNRAFVLRGIRAAIRETRADLVLLQEVLGRHDDHGRRIGDWPTQPQFEFLADEVWPHFAYGRNAIYTSGHHGNAILSRYPLTSWENLDISTNRLERRGLLHATLEIPHRRRPLHAICVHLGLLETERLSQANAVCDRIEGMVPHADPLIVGGDFNDWRARLTRPLRERVGADEAFLRLHGAHARTFPSWLPALRLDRVYYRGMEPDEASALTGEPWTRLSDHAALLVDFRL